MKVNIFFYVPESRKELIECGVLIVIGCDHQEYNIGDIFKGSMRVSNNSIKGFPWFYIKNFSETFVLKSSKIQIWGRKD